MELEKRNTCCFVGDIEMVSVEVLLTRLYDTIKKLIDEEKVDTFLFKSKDGFERVCFCVVTKLKRRYPHIKRIHVRTDFPYINGDFRDDLLDGFEDTYYPGRILHDWKTIYKGQDAERIDLSGFCIICYDENNDCSKRETRLSVEYAKRKDVCIINVGE